MIRTYILRGGHIVKTITIHGIDDVTMEQLKNKAEEAGLSVNKTVKKLLHEVLGIKPEDISSKRSDFEEFCGVWNEDDLSEFDEATVTLNQIESGEWS